MTYIKAKSNTWYDRTIFNLGIVNNQYRCNFCIGIVLVNFDQTLTDLNVDTFDASIHVL